MRRIALVVSLIVAAAIFAMLRYPGKATAATGCDPALWPHVYRSKRLRVQKPCASVEGRVTDVHANEDGDLHIALKPDDVSVLNLANLFHGDGTLVVESVCDHQSDQPDVKAACAGFIPRLAAPAVGVRIRATGAYVKDRENGWMEIHPVTTIEILR